MFKPRKVGWSDEGRRGLHEGGGNCLKYLKRGWNRKEERKNKKFLNGVQAGSRGGCLKKRGCWNPLTNYDKCAIWMFAVKQGTELEILLIKLSSLSHIQSHTCKY